MSSLEFWQAGEEYTTAALFYFFGKKQKAEAVLLGGAQFLSRAGVAWGAT